MSRSRLERIVRQFKENGLKLLLEHPQNVRDLLLLTGADLVNLIDFERLTPDTTTFVERDYRHLEADLVLVAPLRHPGRLRPRRAILIYILLEHQSEPDPLMPLRVLEYVVQIYKHQTREWSRRHRSFAGIRLQPVLPVVFYTGTRRWEAIGRLVDLLELGERFERLTPYLDPLFVNLSATPPGRLQSAGGFFGWVLRLVQQRQARPDAFQRVLRQVVQELEIMPAAQHLRWLELLSYVHALVYHERDRSEHGSLRETIAASVRTGEHRREVAEMYKSMADVLIEKGREEGRKEGEVQTLQRALVHLLRQRFGRLPKTVAEKIKTTHDVQQLNAWLSRTVTAATLAEMGIDEPIG